MSLTSKLTLIVACTLLAMLIVWLLAGEHSQEARIFLRTLARHIL